MIEIRFGESATLLPDGDVLVAGGRSEFGVHGFSRATAELYDPTTGHWALTGRMHTARWGHAAVLLPNGKVLVVGGDAYGGSKPGLLSSAELYDPSSGAWTEAGRMATARAGATATLLRDGRVLLTGGYSSRADGPERSAEVYDPVTGLWAETGAMSVARNGHSATLLPDGHVLVVGGQCCSEPALASAELYDPVTGDWTGTGAPGSARRNHTAILLADGKVLVYGGDDHKTVTSAEIYDPLTGSWVATGSPHIAEPFESGQAAPLVDGRVLAMGVAAGEVYDPVSGSWTDVGGPMSGGPIVHTSTLLDDGRVLVTYEPTAVLFDPRGAP